MTRVLLFTAVVATLLVGCCDVGFDHRNYVIGDGVRYSLSIDDPEEVVATEPLEGEPDAG